MVTIRKQYPLLIPAWIGQSNPFDVTVFGAPADPLATTYDYSVYSWKGFPLQYPTPDEAFPIRGVSPLAGNPLCYPRALVTGGGVTVSPATLTLMQANGIANGIVANGQPLYSGWLVDQFEVNDFSAVTLLAGPWAGATTRADRWQGGDLLLIKQFDTSPVQLRYFNPVLGVFTPEADLIAHDQARINLLQTAFERVKLIYWFLPLGTADDPDFTALAASIVAGVNNAEYHEAANQAEIDDSVLPAVQAFFGV